MIVIGQTSLPVCVITERLNPTDFLDLEEFTDAPEARAVLSRNTFESGLCTTWELYRD